MKMNLFTNYSLFPGFKIKASSAASNPIPKSTPLSDEERQLEQLKRSFDQMREARNKNNKKGLKGSFRLSKHFYNLYNAATPTQAYNVVRIAQSEIRLMKSLGASDQEVAAARRTVRKLSEKAEIKIGSLKKEQRLQEQRQMETNAKHREEVQNLTKELRQKRKARKARERGDLLSAIEEESKKGSSSADSSITGSSENISFSQAPDFIVPETVPPVMKTDTVSGAEGQTIDISL